MPNVKLKTGTPPTLEKDVPQRAVGVLKGTAVVVPTPREMSEGIRDAGKVKPIGRVLARGG